MKIKFLAVATFLLTMVSTEVLAWGSNGHRIVTQIAEQHLSKKAKRNLKKVIGEQKLSYYATWADFVKSDTNYKQFDSWHYVNLPANLTEEGCFEVLEQSGDENLYKRAQILINDLSQKDGFTAKERAEKLYYLIHMIGDLHQPMHAGRPEDLGGNKITVEYFGQRTNIHSVWDSKMIDDEKYSYTEYADVLNRLDKAKIKEFETGELKNWLFESHKLANYIYNEVDTNRTLRYEYQYNNKAILESQLQKAGLRLAKILNEIYG